MSSFVDYLKVMPSQRRSKTLQALSDAATTFTLVRHGETDWNLEHRLQGQQYPGPSLNANGKRQAAAVWCSWPILRHTCSAYAPTQVAAHLAQQQHAPIAAVYSSDLLRAQQTMHAIMQRLPSTVQV